jgi:uncharacterized protein YjbJ (UPF0337 family)
MENNELQAKWPVIKSKLKEKYPSLTEEQLSLETGKEGELLERLQKSLGKNKKEIDNWLSLLG